MNLAHKLQLEALAHTTPSQEVCGLCVLGLDGPHLISCRNISLTPETGFEIDGRDFLRAQSAGRVLYVYHSHPRAGGFSGADMSYAEESGLIQRMYNVEEHKWYEYIPKSYSMPPLEGRSWSWGDQDCWALIRDYFRVNYGANLTDYDRDETSVGLGNTVLANFAREGFVRRAGLGQIQKDDVLVFRTNGSPQHMAIFMGNSKVLHHPLNALSVTTQLNRAWHSRLEFIGYYTGKKEGVV